MKPAPYFIASSRMIDVKYIFSKNTKMSLYRKRYNGKWLSTFNPRRYLTTVHNIECELTEAELMLELL